MQVLFYDSPMHAKRWEEFVGEHPASTNYHRWKWKHIVERVFEWPTFYLAAEEAGEIQGVLPLVSVNGCFGGSSLCSMPFLGDCGIVAQNDVAERKLLEQAISLGNRLGVDYIELRHQSDHRLGLAHKSDKVTVVLPVDADSEKMWKALDTKIRTKIRKSINSGLKAEFGGLEFLDDFYTVFSENMRDLGTPVYSRDFFASIFRNFPDGTYICRVRHQGHTVAASFLIGFRRTLEAKWSSSLRRCLSMKPNMFLYWNLFCFAAQNGYGFFDFGRSTVGSGTHVFKMQWAGTQSIPLHWDYWLANGGGIPEKNPANPKYRLAIRLWQRLPVAVTNTIGPRIVRYFP
jgi:FemAB-related protein (PEP-CTERM system-associated)